MDNRRSRLLVSDFRCLFLSVPAVISSGPTHFSISERASVSVILDGAFIPLQDILSTRLGATIVRHGRKSGHVFTYLRYLPL